MTLCAKDEAGSDRGTDHLARKFGPRETVAPLNLEASCHGDRARTSPSRFLRRATKSPVGVPSAVAGQSRPSGISQLVAMVATDDGAEPHEDASYSAPCLCSQWRTGTESKRSRTVVDSFEGAGPCCPACFFSPCGGLSGSHRGIAFLFPCRCIEHFDFLHGGNVITFVSDHVHDGTTGAVLGLVHQEL